MRVNNTASDLMSILNKRKESDKEETNKIAQDFATFFSQAMQSSPISVISSCTQTSASVASSPLSSYVNQSSAYKEFRDKVITDTYELASDMFSYGANGKYVNQKGYDFIYQRRVDNAKPILPASISEASEKYSVGKENIESYMMALYGEYNIQAFSSLCNNYMSFGYQAWGLQVFENEQSKQNIYKMLNSSEGREITAMMEEQNLYGAISNLAKCNSAFASEYDANPEAAVDKYFRELGTSMASQDNMPRIDTRNSVPYVPTIFNASRGANNQVEFVPLR